MPEIPFTKMQGLGNDFIVLDARGGEPAASLASKELPALAQAWCDRHTGIGADGILLITPSKQAAYAMQIFNPDGSEPEMCGNGIRCVARYLADHPSPTDRTAHRTQFSIETKAGIITPERVPPTNPTQDAMLVRVDMGAPRLRMREIPMAHETKAEGEAQAIGKVLTLPAEGGVAFQYTAVSMGNPHCVIFVDQADTIPLEQFGPAIEHHPLFPERTNVAFVTIQDPSTLIAHIWERGAGATRACGTGACAVVVAAHLTKQAERTATVHLPGGALQITWDEKTNHVFMTGPAEYVYKGVLHAHLKTT